MAKKIQRTIKGSIFLDLEKQSNLNKLTDPEVFFENNQGSLITPFTLAKLLDKNINKLWIRGGYPRSYLHKTDQKNFEWRANYIKTFLERDSPQLGFNVPARTI